MKISIAGLDKAAVLAALYNAAKPLGLGWMHYDPTPMSIDLAREILKSGQTYFDYLQGRVMKVDLSGDEFDSRLYDLDNGEGAAERALKPLRK